MIIAIPTSGRAKTIITHQYIPEEWRNKTRVICPPDEVKAYTRACPGFEVVPCPCDRLSPKLQWIAERYRRHRYVFMPNDDAKLFRRKKMSSPKLTPMLGDTVALERMWRTLESRLANDNVAWVALSNRSGNNHKKTGYDIAGRSYGFWGVDTHILNRHGLRFDVIETMQDFYMQLALLTRGYRTYVYYRWCWDQRGGSNSAGGCSVYRTPHMQETSVAKLQRDFPDFVTPVQRKTKTGWFNGETRTDVRIQWKQALKSGLRS